MERRGKNLPLLSKDTVLATQPTELVALSRAETLGSTFVELDRPVPQRLRRHSELASELTAVARGPRSRSV
jgi:hypothetical protein